MACALRRLASLAKNGAASLGGVARCPADRHQARESNRVPRTAGVQAPRELVRLQTPMPYENWEEFRDGSGQFTSLTAGSPSADSADASYGSC
ncbi:MAG: hypothetical protein EHM23_17880 [Acidobacteria bacterium]|nr:MAG: hypothetical protein EHM23_17880 [Acidobacteriota bacterium]